MANGVRFKNARVLAAIVLWSARSLEFALKLNMRPLVAFVLAAVAVAAVDGRNFCDLIECSDKVAPVCASNGVSYDNACRFQIAKCSNETLTITAVGKCGAAVASATPSPSAPTASASPSPAPSTPKPAASVTAAPVAVCEMMCMDVYDPICGSDGKTYTNNCELQLANCDKKYAHPTEKAVTVASKGECGAEADAATTAPPTTIPKPRNDSSSASDADAGAEDSGSGDSLVRLCEMLCPTTYQPVCGSDNKTYANSCELRRAACSSRGTLTQVSDGECGGEADADKPTAAPSGNATTPSPSPSSTATVKCPRACPKIMKPVCGSNGETYNNQCEFENAKCTLKIATLSMTNGECVRAETTAPAANSTAAPANSTTPAPTPSTTPRKCSQMCTDQYAPVCGSDGKTYSNKCHFNIAKCRLGTAATLSVASDGECTAAADADTAACPRVCPQVLQPVCGSDGVTYNNKCEFEVAKCTKRIAGAVMTSTAGECA